MNRRHMLTLGLAALATTPALAHPPTLLSPEGHKHTAEEIIAFRKDLADAVVLKDVVKLRTLYADSFTHTHTTSKVDGKDARIVALLAGEPTIEIIPAQNLAINILAGGWVAIATGITPITAMSDGKVYAVHWTATYTRTETGWQLAASHATRGRELIS
ncbi:MAG: nuclear transport factor 2 family protein [Bosea sp. (in: a-proteobacteria)]